MIVLWLISKIKINIHPRAEVLHCSWPVFGPDGLKKTRKRNAIDSQEKMGLLPLNISQFGFVHCAVILNQKILE